MTKARTLADLLDSSGDVKSSALDNATSSLSDLSVTATASELNTLDGIMATTAEINYLDGVTSNVQSQIDGISSEVVDDTTPSLGGDLSTNGNDVNFGDNDKAQFGTGNDLQIYHDGTQSIIQDTGTGPLRIRTPQFRVQNGSEIMLLADADSYTKLYHNGAEKLTTASTGVTVAGRVEVDQVTAPTVVLDSTAANDTAMAPYISFQRGGSEKAWLGYGTSANNHFRINQGLNGPLTFHTNGVERLGINGDGSWRSAPAGTVMQTKQTQVTSHGSLSLAAGTWTEFPSLSVTITPRSSSSKFLIFVNMWGEHSVNPQDTTCGLKRGSTILSRADFSNRHGGLATPAIVYHGDQDSTAEWASYNYLDSPATSSAITYKAVLRRGNQANTYYYNRTVGNANDANREVYMSTITVMEIAG